MLCMFQAVSPPIIRSSKTVHTASGLCQACLLLPFRLTHGSGSSSDVAAIKQNHLAAAFHTVASYSNYFILSTNRLTNQLKKQLQQTRSSTQKINQAQCNQNFITALTKVGH